MLSLRSASGIALCFVVGAGCVAAQAPGGGHGVRGRVTDAHGQPVAGAFVTARLDDRGIATTVFTNSAGRYVLPDLPPGGFGLEAHKPGWRRVTRNPEELASGGAVLDFALERDGASRNDVPSSRWLSLLPEGGVKRRFVLDCNGCHPFNRAVVYAGDSPRSREGWVAAVEKMLAFAGSTTAFPIISPERDAEATADWLAGHLAGVEPPAAGDSPPEPPASAHLSPVITEYDLPGGNDLPHDLMLDGRGGVVVTGMFSGVLYRLEPDSGRFSEIPIPLPQANPRALEIESGGGPWWVLLGGPQQIARFDPAAGTWKFHDLGMYPHSIARDREGGIWFNGHFSRDPELIGRLDPASGEIRTFEVPPPPQPRPGSPIPYELRMGPDGRVWGSELLGNRIFAFSPDRESFELHELPSSESGPRRLDVDAQGIVWIPEYAGNRLARFDPRTRRFEEYELPTPDALPYVARVDREREYVWVAEAGADAIARFDPRTKEFAEIPLPARSTLIRHMEVDPATGVVWAAYAPAPAVDPKVVRVELRAER